ncbi:MAG: hypothetical protein IPJ07_20560 [Acidobacteria bacterium]|nr:hypothetical protein [Acidobacteriota bacterium]
MDPASAAAYGCGGISAGLSAARAFRRAFPGEYIVELTVTRKEMTKTPSSSEEDSAQQDPPDGRQAFSLQDFALHQQDSKIADAGQAQQPSKPAILTSG